jgi:tRNA (guanine37-N1)-methyltransferase
MRIDILTVLPTLLESPLGDSIVKRAKDKGHVEIHVHQLRDFTEDAHKTVDDYPYGGGAGMVLLAGPISKAIEKLKSERNYDEVIYLTPDGETLNQGMVNQLSLNKNLLFLCGHYKGIDDRIRQIYITKEISIGDYVLTGGEIAAAVLCDAIVRLLPGVIGDETSALTDSFQDHLLAPPVYTRPEEFNGLKVPEVLMGGNHADIEKWRFEQAIERTKLRRPDLLDKSGLGD